MCRARFRRENRCPLIREPALNYPKRQLTCPKPPARAQVAEVADFPSQLKPALNQVRKVTME